jgi:hypothetical protein
MALRTLVFTFVILATLGARIQGQDQSKSKKSDDLETQASVSGYGDVNDVYNGGLYGGYPGYFNGLGTAYGGYYGYYGSPYSGLGYNNLGYAGLGYGRSGYSGLGYGGLGYGGYGTAGVYPGYGTYGNLAGYGGYYGRPGLYR